jgi:spermidine/putrescine transport system ATP-binding protein
MLEVRDIHKMYAGQPLLRGVSFQVEAGETICLLGASGSGKSTLLRIIAGLEQADAGQVLWQGKNVLDIPVHQRGFGLMFQDYALFPHQTVGENVAFGLRMQKVPRGEIARRVQQALDLVNMAAFARRRVTDLSGGEQQRVALARALAPRPRLLMLDEPLGALDRTLKEEVEEEIRLLLHSTAIPAIYVTHDQEEAFAIADRLVLLNQGQVEQSGTPADVYAHPGTPWVAHFMGLSNLLPGKIIRESPLQADTDLGIFQGMGQPSRQPRLGERVTLLLRSAVALSSGDRNPAQSEAGRIAAEKPGVSRLAMNLEQVNTLRGVVTDSVFRGSGFRVTLDCPNERQFSFLLPAALTPGAEMIFSLCEEDIQFLQEKYG